MDIKPFYRLNNFLNLCLSACDPPSESDLRSQFTQNKAILLQLLQMQAQDPKVVEITPKRTRLENDWNWPREDIGFTEDRWNEYRSLFSEAGIDYGIQKGKSGFWFFVSIEGLSIIGRMLGFIYATKLPDVVVSSFADCPHKNGVCYIKLEENWYLFQWDS